jgi:hypothetical protein
VNQKIQAHRRRWFLALGVLILAGVSGGLFGLHRWTRHQLRTARDLLADLRFEETGRLLDDYLRIRPSDAEAHLLAAEAKRRAGDPKAALYHLNEFDRRQGQTPASSLERILLLAERGAGARERMFSTPMAIPWTRLILNRFTASSGWRIGARFPSSITR